MGVQQTTVSSQSASPYALSPNFIRQLRNFMNNWIVEGGSFRFDGYRTYLKVDKQPSPIEVKEPENPLVIGPADEGSEAADTATWPPEEDDETNDGVTLRIQTRQGYFDEGDHVWYAYVRDLTWPRSIAPAISAETRIIIDEPQ